MKHVKKIAVLLVSILAPLPALSASMELPLFLPYPKFDDRRWFYAHGWSNGAIQGCEWRKQALKAEDGALKMTISNLGVKVSDYSCGEIQTRKLYQYGLFSVQIKAAKGSGLNTAFFTYIGPVHKKPHEEIDIEILGKDPTKAQLNYYLNGVPQGETLVDLGFDSSEAFHTYSFMWEPDRIVWFVDDKRVHETPAGKRIPSLEAKIYLSLWAGAPVVNEWLGPFKYEQDVSAYFKDVRHTALPQYPIQP